MGTSSGNAPRRFHAPGAHLRNFKKASKHGVNEYQQVPKPPQSPSIWDPRDPFIVEYRAAHPRVEAAWRRCPWPAAKMTGLGIETINRALT